MILFYVRLNYGHDSALATPFQMMDRNREKVEMHLPSPPFICPKVHLQIKGRSQCPLLTALLCRQPVLRRRPEIGESRPNAFSGGNEIECIHVAPCPQEPGHHWAGKVTYGVGFTHCLSISSLLLGCFLKKLHLQEVFVFYCVFNLRSV